MLRFNGKNPTSWGWYPLVYIGAGYGFKSTSFEDKAGRQTANVKTGNLIAGVQYKKYAGIEARLGIGLGSGEADFDCGKGHECNLSVSSPLTASLFGRAQMETKYVTPYVLAGATYQKFNANLADEYGNQDYCSVTVRLRDDVDICENDPNAFGELSGRIIDPNGQPLSGRNLTMKEIYIFTLAGIRKQRLDFSWNV